jgi:aspartyl-tRNA(Asn)/glutamyl-tRNA(Gln) amidotransferase subunit B
MGGAKQITYEAVIGLEIHVQLSTGSKIFCADDTAFGRPANSQTSVISLAHPGTLPKLNEAVIPKAVKMGLACGCEITRVNNFDRKHYFYPDSPQGYQITQQQTPICLGGGIPVQVKGEEPRTIPLNRIHLEADAGKLIHDAGDRYSLVDLNRAGMPLIEMVTEPAIHSAAEAGAVLTEVRKIARFLDISDGNMEEGSLRCDANISVREAGSEALGQKVEIKNMNSIRNVKRAIEHEIKRQITELSNGKDIIPETRLFDVATSTTEAMREKEEAEDYRYFADPDLPPFVITDEWLAEIKSSMEPIPSAYKTIFTREYGLSEYDATVLTEEKMTADWFLKMVKAGVEPKTGANWLMGPVKSQLNTISGERFKLQLNSLIDLVNLVEEKTVNYNIAVKQILPVLSKNNELTALELVEQLGVGLEQSSEELEQLIARMLEDMPAEVAAYQKGKKALLQRFMGEVMKRSKGKAEPQATLVLLRKILD